MECVHGDSDLLEVIGALDSRRSLTHLLDRRQQQPDEDSYDGDYHQQFDEGKGSS
jgi:hypothetical protein